MKVGKPKSKRVPGRLRYKIEKRSAAKQRKDRKAAKKDITWKSRLKKDPGIPNLFPYKDKILKEIEDGRKRKEEEAVRRREQARAQREGDAEVPMQTDEAMRDEEDDDDDDVLLDLEDEELEGDDAMDQEDSLNPMAALLASARARVKAFNNPTNASDFNDEDDSASDADSFASFSAATPNPTTTKTKKDSSQKAYFQTITNLISSADILLYVLDARDPLSTRSVSIEQTILSNPNKRLILILNKIDLIPTDILKRWLLYFRTAFPTLPLRSSSSSAPSAKQFDHKTLTASSTATNLIRALKSYSASRASTTVGVLGYPNVGKSSVINALTSRLSGKAPNAKSKKECPVGAEAGITTTLREVKLDGKIKLIDSPGVVFASSASETTNSISNTNSNSNTNTNDDTTTVVPNGKLDKKAEDTARLILLNALPPREFTDPIPAVTLLLNRFASSETLMARLLEVYNLPALMSTGATKDKTTDFLIQVARKRGRLGKGGVPNLHAAALTVIGDWRDGRVQGWVEPPSAPSLSTAKIGKAADEKKIVSDWAKEFRIEGLWGDETDDGQNEGSNGGYGDGGGSGDGSADISNGDGDDAAMVSV